MNLSEPSFWAILAVLLAPGGVGFLWLKRRLNITDDAATAVAGEGSPKPHDYDQALIVLAARVERQDGELTRLRIYLPQVIGWGHRGWAHAPAERREPLPMPPDGGLG